MTYKLEFHPDALKEWKKTPTNIKKQFKKVLIRRMDNPKIPSARLHGDLKNCYKIKQKSSGYRLVYQVKDSALVIAVIAVGKRENNNAYILAKHR